MIFKLKKKFLQCSFCSTHNETIFRLCNGYLIVQQLWNQLKILHSQNLDIPFITPDSTVVGILHTENDHLISKQL